MVKANGRLYHHFWGTYYATIVLVTDSPKHTADLRPALVKATGKIWKHGKTKKSLQTTLKRGHKLEDVLDYLQAHRIDGGSEAIDGTEKSIDSGPLFEIRVATQPKEQLSLFPNPAWKAVFE